MRCLTPGPSGPEDVAELEMMLFERGVYGSLVLAHVRVATMSADERATWWESLHSLDAG
jgi:hypothetical protein